MDSLSTFFLGNIGQENVFYDILHRKNAFVAYNKKSSKSRKTDFFPKGLTHSFGPKLAFLGHKNKKFKKSKNWHFSKGVSPCFFSKNGPFSNFFFLRNIGQENVFYEILHRKNAFAAYENNKFWKIKNWHLSKGVNP